MAGEGVGADVGRDGETFCVVTDGGTLLDMMPDDDVSEMDWRRASSIRRFAIEQERDDYVAARGWPARTSDSTDAPRASIPGRFHFRLQAGMTNSDARVFAGMTDEGKLYGRLRATLADRREVREDVFLAADEWARFEAELRLLNPWRWQDFGVGAVDGLNWEMQHKLGSRVDSDARGVNAYPPDGDPDVTPEFLRMLLATERLFGRSVWPGFEMADALDDIPDERDRVEHLLLAGVRSWAEEAEEAGADPSAMKEIDFEKALLPHLRHLDASARNQVTLRETTRQSAMLDQWPGVGSLDIAVDVSSGPVWVELKWAKEADTLHNCTWDAAKLARAVRDRKASYGYLLAGAPVSEWDQELRCSGLFGVSTHLEDSIVSGYGEKWWPRFAKESQAAYPRLLPCPIITVPVGRVVVRSPKGVDWQVRLARVEAPGEAEFVPPHLAVV
jgi:hypothetical protein